AKVDVAERGAFLHDVGVVAAYFVDTAADVLDVRDLRTEMAVQQLHAVQHVFALQQVDDIDELRRREAEHAAVAGGRVPVAADAHRRLDAHADDRLHAHHAAALDDYRHFRRRFDDEYADEA